MSNSFQIQILLISTLICSSEQIVSAPNTLLLKNKIIPDIIKEEATTALSFYPELESTHIEFKFKPSLKKSLMKAQPKFGSLFKSKKQREYVILMSENFTLDGVKLDFNTIPKNVLIGWLGHELGHIMDYQNRSNLNLVSFGINYYFSGKFIQQAERTADTYAVTHQMKPFILATKDYILNHSGLSNKYKARIRKLYLSPDEIMMLVEEKKED